VRQPMRIQGCSVGSQALKSLAPGNGPDVIVIGGLGSPRVEGAPSQHHSSSPERLILRRLEPLQKSEVMVLMLLVPSPVMTAPGNSGTRDNVASGEQYPAAMRNENDRFVPFEVTVCMVRLNTH